MNFRRPRKNNIPAGNTYDKYHSKNPLYRYEVNRFLKTLDNLILSLDGIKTILEVGCGEGFLVNRVGHLNKYSRLEGIDISEEIIKKAKTSYPHLKLSVGSLYNLNYKTDEFDLVLACEVLEHLEDYEKALDEIKRVTKKYCIISVPVEPLWRVLNFIRGKYILSLGNTPGHIQHWNKKSFLNLLNKYFSVSQIRYPLPWQIALCKKD